MTSADLQSAFESLLKADDYPCVGAKSALAQGAITFFEGEEITHATSDLPLYQAVKAFGEKLDAEPGGFQTFVAAFHGPDKLDEQDFELALWDRLQGLHNIDMAQGREWAGDTDDDPASAHFSMSIAGRAYFVIGLHPQASRTARRFDFPVMVFNAHEQFEALRAQGRFERMKEVIRERDEELDGPNPMLDDHGESSEARQYSGRAVPEDWECPLEIQQPLESQETREAQEQRRD